MSDVKSCRQALHMESKLHYGASAAMMALQVTFFCLGLETVCMNAAGCWSIEYAVSRLKAHEKLLKSLYRKTMIEKAVFSLAVLTCTHCRSLKLHKSCVCMSVFHACHSMSLAKVQVLPKVCHFLCVRQQGTLVQGLCLK